VRVDVRGDAREARRVFGLDFWLRIVFTGFLCSGPRCDINICLVIFAVLVHHLRIISVSAICSKDVLDSGTL
jgi:hypothetical protein